MKKQKRKKRIIIFAVVFAVALALDWWGFSMKPVSYTVSSDKLTEPVRIVFISDLHNCFYGGHDQSGLWDAIEEAEPDIVLFGGDVIDSRGKGTSNALTLMKLAVEKYPCAYATGNHELRRKDRKAFYAEVEKLGIPVLHGKYTDIDVKGQKVRIFGVTNATAKSELDSCCAALSPERYNILLAHEPQEFGEYIDAESKLDASFDLILSGHAHGGQWRLPYILEQGLYAPDQGIFPEFTTGQRTSGDTTQIVSRGLARNLNMITVPRIFNRPELSIIDIIP